MFTYVDVHYIDRVIYTYEVLNCCIARANNRVQFIPSPSMLLDHYKYAIRIFNLDQKNKHIIKKGMVLIKEKFESIVHTS